MRRIARLTISMGAAALLIAAHGCRKEPVDRQELLTAHSLGLNDLQIGQLSEAEQQFKKVVQLAPDDPLGYANLGLTYLRGARYREAETQLNRARRMNSTSPEIALIAAKLYALTGRMDDAREILEKLRPDARVVYALGELEAAAADSGARERYERRLREVLTLAPGNLAVRLKLVDALMRRGAADSAMRHLEDVRRLRPEPPVEARPLLDSTMQLLRSGRPEMARPPFDRFLHLMELTSPYQAALEEVKWLEGPLVGRPVLAFNPQSLITTRGLMPRSRVADVQFTDMTSEAGIGAPGSRASAMALGDYDGDGTDNLFVSLSAGAASQRSVPHVYAPQGGYLSDVTTRAGITLPTGAAYATFADFDNDGWLDLYAIGGDGRGHLLRNDGRGAFGDVTAKARVADVAGARSAIVADLDHDGDLDLFVVGADRSRLYRNNLDGTFTDLATTGNLAISARAADAAIGDFNGDARIDVVVANPQGAPGLYLNAAGGTAGFRDAAASSGIALATGYARVAVGDYNNDGWLDILLASTDAGPLALWRNRGDGTFAPDARSAAAFARLGRVGTVGAEFVDYDNDGWLDLLAAGRRGVFLLRNNGSGVFDDRSRLLPAALQASGRDPEVTAIAVSDVDADGDQDFFLGDSVGVHLLRNDGGNTSLAMQVQLQGLRTGSGKNNTFGIGSRLEVRAGEIYQTRVVTSRITHFGLGTHLKADVLRVEWTNGVPQTIYFPGTDQDVLELEQLKGSCAFLYTWDGKQFRFVTDVMWRSALGMPLGIMGGTSKTAYAPAGASQEFLRIPGDALQPRNGRYVLQFTEELWETAFLDEIRLLAVDHPDSVEIFVDERFVPPGPVQLRTFQAVRRSPPLSAVDHRGTDVLPALRDRDDVYVSNFTPTRYQGIVEPHHVTLDLGKDAGRAGTLLFLRGWIYPTDASINVALGQQQDLRAVMPSLEVRNTRGEWETAIDNIGFPSGKDKTIVIDLAGKFPTADHHVRIRTNMYIAWDQAFVASNAPPDVARTTTIDPVAADLHTRGFSRMYRKGGSGPHWFAYDDVRKDSPWRTIKGAFTRLGDVLPLLRDADDRYVIMAPGDETTVQFDATSVGAVPPGWQRTFLLYTDGWIKDADLNTAFGNTVEPLPFHAIKSYPYAPGEAYPADSARQRYLREYNTRVVRR